MPSFLSSSLHFVLDLFCIVIGISFVETLVKPISTRLFRNHAPRLAGQLLEQLDPYAPELFRHLDADGYEEVIRYSMETITGESWSMKRAAPVIKEYRKLYDPLKAVSHVPGSPAGSLFSGSLSTLLAIGRSASQGTEGSRALQ